MAVDTQDQSYRYWSPDWKRMRDVVGGQRAMQASAEEYLRIPPGIGDSKQKARYIDSALFFEATLRTLQGLVGLAFYRDPEITLPTSMKAFIDDVTQDGVPLRQFIQRVFWEVMGFARVGVLLDYPKKDPNVRTRLDEERAKRRPLLSYYCTENIFHTATSEVNGVITLTEVRLREIEREKVGEWDSRWRDRIRILLLEQQADGSWAYRQRLFVNRWTNDGDTASPTIEEAKETTIQPTDADATAWQELDPIVPLDASGRPLSYMPFWIINEIDQSSEIHRPPLIGLANANISHYATTGQLENALWWCGNPTPYATGVDTSAGQSFTVGSTELWLFKEATSQVGFLSYGEDALAPLEKRLDRLEQQMAILGARMLSPDQKGVEAADTARIHRQGEVSVLAGVCGSVSRSFTDIVRAAVEWQNGTKDAESIVRIITAFFDAVLSADDALKLMKLWQSGVLSIEDFLQLLKKGELMPGDRTIEEIVASNQTSPIQPIMTGLTDTSVGSTNAPEPPPQPTPKPNPKPKPKA